MKGSTSAPALVQGVTPGQQCRLPNAGHHRLARPPPPGRNLGLPLWGPKFCPQRKRGWSSQHLLPHKAVDYVAHRPGRPGRTQWPARSIVPPGALTGLFPVEQVARGCLCFSHISLAPGGRPAGRARKGEKMKAPVRPPRPPRRAELRCLRKGTETGPVGSGAKVWGFGGPRPTGQPARVVLSGHSGRVSSSHMPKVLSVDLELYAVRCRGNVPHPASFHLLLGLPLGKDGSACQPELRLQGPWAGGPRSTRFPGRVGVRREDVV